MKIDSNHREPTSIAGLTRGLTTLTLAALTVLFGVAPASAGFGTQGMNPQGMNPQGMNPQGMNPQGIRLRNVELLGLSLPSLPLAGSLNGSELSGLAVIWPLIVVFEGSDLIGATLSGDLLYENEGETAWHQVVLTIEDVQLDTAENTMTLPCVPATDCPWPYDSNHDVMLYRLSYEVVRSDQPSAPLCAGDGLGMFFSGVWEPNGGWIDDDGMLTFSCNSGVLAKCARNWGYKPWRSDMRDQYGAIRDMREFHQACTRAAMADYSGEGYAATLTGTPIDLFDNAGFNTPTSAIELVSLGFASTMWFEAIFTSHWTENDPLKSDYWSYYWGQSRHDELPSFEESYGYEVDWGTQSPKAMPKDVGISWAQDFMLPRGYAYGRVEIAVFNPVWETLGSQVASGSTSDSFNHFTPSCRVTSHAPDQAYRWTAPATGTYTFTTEGSSYDTLLYAYKGGNEIACNDDYGGSLTSRITLSLVAGDDVTVFIDGYGAAAGDYVLNIE